MISTAAMRFLGPWLVGFYLIAQVCGVIPLMTCDSAHAAPAAMLLSECQYGSGALPEPHHSGDADDATHHHALQDLYGVPVYSADRCEITRLRAAIPVLHPQALAEADRVLLERPPKPVLSI